MNTSDKIKYSRSPKRATAKDYIKGIFSNFMEMHGDRRFGDDKAMICGIAWLKNKAVTVIGIEKGKDLVDKVNHNFGCVAPEGYRKALRAMKQAEKFKRPVVCFVDTQGAACGDGAEERGAGQAIAENLAEMMTLKVPVITVVIGEGGSGGALALSVSDEICMLENAYYSVITPEACASILYKDASKNIEAAEHLKLFARDLYDMKIVDKIISEPEDFTDKSQLDAFMEKLEKHLYKKLGSLEKKSVDELLENRYKKFRSIGQYSEIFVDDSSQDDEHKFSFTEFVKKRFVSYG